MHKFRLRESGHGKDKWEGVQLTRDECPETLTYNLSLCNPRAAREANQQARVRAIVEYISGDRMCRFMDHATEARELGARVLAKGRSES